MANKIIHKRSSVVTDGVAKLPKSSELEYGELAINFGSGAETISLKNSNDEIVEFKSNNYYEAVIKENEFITATALTDLDDRTTALENFIQSDDFITKEDLDNKVDNDVFTTYTGSTATNTEDLTNRLATLESVVEDNEFVTAGSLSDLNKRITNVGSKVDNCTSNDAFNAYTGSTATNTEALINRLATLEEVVEDNEFVTAGSLSDLNKRIANVDEKVEHCVSNDSFKEFTDAYEEDERVVAAAFTTLDEKVAEVGEIFDTYTGTTAPSMFAAKEHTHEQYITNTTFEEFKEEVNKDARVIAAALTTLDTRMNEEFITNAEFEDFQSIIDKDNLVVATSLTDLNNRMAKVENGGTSYELTISAIEEGLTGTLSSEEMNKLLAADTVIVNYANYKLTPITKAEAEGILSYSYALDTLHFRMTFGGTTYAIINVSDNKPISKYVWELSDISDGASGQIPSTEVTKMFNASEIIISNGIISYSILAKAVSDAYNVLTFFESMSTFKIVNIAVLPDGTYEIAHNSLN